jgi:adenylate kinase family enzyme
MAYPYPYGFEEQTRRMQDLEYMQQLYPQEAKNTLRKVIYHVDPIDYKGSFIYDEYPDQLQLYRVVASIFAEMKKEAAEKAVLLGQSRAVFPLAFPLGLQQP